MTITFLTRNNKRHTINTNNPAVFELLSLLGYRILSQQ